MSRYLFHFGGNGHDGCRLESARSSLANRTTTDGSRIELIDVPYPGFEGRPRVEGFQAFLNDIASWIHAQSPAPDLAYGSGIGALILLALRSEGHLDGVPLIFQGPVLWGLENRWFPRIMRFRPARRWLAWAIQTRPAQTRFLQKHFRTPRDAQFRRRFFGGYARCEAFSDAFDWFTPAFLRELERRFRERPSGLSDIRVWVGSMDHVVGLDEVRITERALGVTWPVTVFEGWGHYPMIDVPEEWADALRNALVPTDRI